MTEPGLSRNHAWALTFVATLTMTISYIDRQTLSVLAPVVTRELSISEVNYGWIAAAFSAAYLLGAPLAGRWIDRVGARRGLPMAVLVWSAVAAAHTLIPVASGFIVLFALRIALGIAEGPSFPGAAQIVQRSLPPDERSRGFGVLFTGSSIGAMIAPALVSLLLRYFHWRVAFLGTALFGLLWIPLWRAVTASPAARRALDRNVQTEHKASPNPLDVLTNPAVFRNVALVIASAPTTGFVLLWGAKYLAKTFSVPQVDMGKYLWLPPLMFDLGAVAFGDVASRRARARAHDGRPDKLLVAIGAALTCSVAAMSLAPNVWIALFIAGGAMAGASALYTLSTSDMLSRLPPEAISLASGIAAASQSLAYIIVNPLIGRAVQTTGGYRSTVLTLGLWVLPCSAIWLLWSPARTGKNTVTSSV